jgi:YHYH protein
VVAQVLTACRSAPSPTSTGSTGSSTNAAGVAATVASSGAVNLVAVPLGDGYLSTSPKIGYVDSCQTSLPSTGGATPFVSWINTVNKTWNAFAKPQVRGSVEWKGASYTVKVSGATRTIATADLPTDHSTGTFPISSSDPVSAYARISPQIEAQAISWSLPANPTASSTPSCTSGGPIGMLLFNALDGEEHDAGAHEVLDSCDEHPQMGNELHHHFVPSCIVTRATGTSALVGYAIDGFGIYVGRDASGNILTNADLDGCHGRTSPVMWNGAVTNICHDDAPYDYPSTVRCFHGTSISTGSGPG